jgi:threonine aldolase
VQTNIVCFDVGDLGVSSELFVSKLKENGILALTMGPDKVRMVAHRGIEEQHVKMALEEIERISKNLNF